MTTTSRIGKGGPKPTTTRFKERNERCGGIRCNKCRAFTFVLDSRTSEGGFAVRRRRLCTKCEHRFTTEERICDEFVADWSI